MPYVQFALKNHRADLLLVLALWHELVTEWYPGDVHPLRVNMRQRAAQESLSAYLHSAGLPDVQQRYAERACGFDIVLRLASEYVDTMHSTSAFFADEENSRWFTQLPGRAQGGTGGNRHNEVALTTESLALWESSAEATEKALVDARRLLESDIESRGIIVALLPKTGTSAVPVAAQPARYEVQQDTTLSGKTADRAQHLAAFVRHLHEDQFQPTYRKKPIGEPVAGWNRRLLAYFWPTPDQNYQKTSSDTNGFGETSRELAEVLLQQGHWTEREQQRAVALAKSIFSWGGVPQKPETVTPENVEHVFRSAIRNDAAANAKMNSGWTKVSAFATAHLENSEGGQPQVIWDSRVAAAITSRLDKQLPDDGNPAELFPGVGTVPGRGGTRPRALTKPWQSAYMTWVGQVSGSQIVREIRDILNNSTSEYPAMPLPDGGTGLWTTRGVEMVLFMDGY